MIRSGKIDPLASEVKRLAEYFQVPVTRVLQRVIVGGESGNDTGKYRYRPCELEWIENIVETCQFYGVPVFVKQLGTHLAKQLKLRDRHGRDWSEWPEALRVRQFPGGITIPAPVDPLPVQTDLFK